METKQSIIRKYIELSSLLFITACLSGCGSEVIPPETLAANNIVQVKRFWRVDTEEDLSKIITCKQSEGYYAVIELEALSNRPATVNGAEVTDPRLWPCIAVCYPKGKTIKSKNAVRFRVEPLFYPTSPEYAPIPLGPMGPQVKVPNFKGLLKLHISSQPKEARKQLKKLAKSEVRGDFVVLASDKLGIEQSPVLKHKFDDGIIPYWMFLGPTHATPGEYTLEILVHPFFAGIKPGAASPIGSPVLVYKGTVEITE